MEMTFDKKIPRILLIAAALVIGIVLGLWQTRPTAPPREGAEEYAAYQRMLANIQRLASEPHPSGSGEIETTRSQIIAEIRAMGLTPVIQDATYTASDIADEWLKMYGAATKDEWWEQNREWVEDYYDGVHSLDGLIEATWPMDGETLPLQNILVKLDSPLTDRGVMFVSHYDSVSTAPGAADDTLAVCAMLEAMRAHAQNPVLENDIYFLFTDGEEHGLLGAWKFVDANPGLRDSIDMVINLEMRGNRGGVLLFETSAGAYSMLKTVKQSGARTIGTSWAAAIYTMMPNNTDLTAFLDAGYNGINYAAIEGVEHYHMPSDSYENLNKSTAYHYLQTVLSLAGYAARNSLDGLRGGPSPEAVYFPFLPGVIVLMTALASRLLCAAACVLALAFAVIKAMKKELKASFGNILMCLLFILSILSTVLFESGSYLFYIPLLLISITSLLKKWTIAHIAVRVVSGIAALLIWIPVVFLLWVSMVQPMML